MELVKFEPGSCVRKGCVSQVRCFRKSSPNASHRRISTRRVSHAQSDNRTPAAPFVVNPRFLRARALFLTSPCFVRVVRCLPVCRKPWFFLGHRRFLTRPVSDKSCRRTNSLSLGVKFAEHVRAPRATALLRWAARRSIFFLTSCAVLESCAFFVKIELLA